MRRILLSLLLAIAPIARGQTIRGVVRESASGGSVPGAIVIVMDSGRIMLNRALTNARGEYELPRAPDARILRTVRLGFRPTELPIPASASPTLRLDVNMITVPLTLDAVRTLAAAPCPRRKDSQAALSLLEQARTGLLATIVARESKPATITRLEIIRKRNFETDDIMSMSVVMDSAQATNSYVASLSAQAFVEHGFANDSVGVRTAFGPDAEVLLDEAFANGYCFRVMDAVPERPHQIGLGFVAAEHKRGRIEIDGALWIDTTAKSLVDIEFLYRGFAQLFDRGKPGGHVIFRTMANGVVLIDRWFLRIPTRESRKEDERRGAMVSFRAGSLIIQETGGELARARWEDGTSWRASLGSARMKLLTIRGKPDSGRVLRLDSTTYIARSDADGNVEINELPPGPYHVSLVDERLIQIGLTIPTDANFFAIRDSTLTFNVPTRTLTDYVRDRCVSDKQPVGEAMVIGRILDPDSLPANNVSLVLDRKNTTGKLVPVSDGGDTGSDGLFRWCGFERDWDVVISARRDRLKRVIEVPGLDPGVTVLQFKLRPPEP